MGCFGEVKAEGGRNKFWAGLHLSRLSTVRVDICLPSLIHISERRLVMYRNSSIFLTLWSLQSAYKVPQTDIMLIRLELVVRPLKSLVV